MRNILWFSEIGINDVPKVGGKNASLGEMIGNLAVKGVSVPNGFATTAEAYFNFLTQTGLDKKIETVLKDLDFHNLKQLSEKGKAVRELIIGAELTQDLKDDILSAYAKLSQNYKVENTDVAVRSSATAEDLPGASFAGQQETYLNIAGPENVLFAVKKCFASLFTDRAIVYRQEMGFSHTKVGLSAGVQKMVRSDLGASGVMFSCDTESGFGDVVLINASYGLGENVVQGAVEPDQYYVFETTLKKGFKPVIEKKIGSKLVKMVYTKNAKQPTKNIATTKKEREIFVLNNEEILNLAKWSMIVEDHYQKSMDMEWAKDGRDGKLYIVQARPETVQSRKNLKVLENYVLQTTNYKLQTIANGMSVGSKIGSGKTNKILSAKDIEKFKKGEVLVTVATDPDWVPAMKLASAIVTDSGGRTCHAAIVGRELGVPVIVGTGNGTKNIKAGQEVTIDCSQGEDGKVYEGIIPFEIKKTDISNIANTKTKILMNVGEPSNAFNLSFIPNDGVGLAREEFIIINSVKVHPNALINYKTLKPALKKKIDALTLGYADKTQFYIDKLAEGVGTIGSAFYPKPVIVRFSDFKTNEYRSLLGGELYEPKEENPMIGFRGASRYYDKKFKDGFVLECKAIKKVREEFGLDNIIPMVPFCRTLDEGRKVVQIMEENGLKRDPFVANAPQGDIDFKSLKIYVMCEIPANVILAEQFLEIFDGFSIGSNDLTQLTLGLDRDNSELSSIGNEKNEAVKELIEEAIRVCQNNEKYIGICGQGPSDFPDFAKFLVELGIESISLNPDSVLKTKIAISETEKKLNK
ncbi:MAG: phosphoenolpyruvate synthase [Candidatus Staskawiczbacteria bacterium RIFOXYD2_FULL_37_9]|uniref:Phosphoenolpyruvate synthase n=1 Tax=Candidatus Staskawiczbacteria bacterium RIFOXYB1_FULL_37_44 TaxID=1802223 RepID=A0A1G2IZ63_9BACT|nr:MAG: phosphoenolpyruvate synthase [Candidatus Staskawiczbacteria bacterium RIFOXYB1_FULL_37_44]OGZ83482.1 MAG: phosphoenolpyruvate synthase [Candidatus Staskawiczbacteria bacterium RIFOXYC1_FULL_37_52]OGZ89647.1 MAG: phosphoenolpyruvate synthase [Candidatus Staskawiczbacteria bacterium RIFOXYC2_FULL_37_19]OGZ90179.1 MAG: phosphoenolpyruvate synthase [Candidatus Staskawiczbacteria bacterium RIFOXYD1_FULL_37_110]OGZ94719.1 MAG: phosphoenolpyruvate synthase [Candidatus Staskawiczbacteria bacter